MLYEGLILCVLVMCFYMWDVNVWNFVKVFFLLCELVLFFNRRIFLVWNLKILDVMGGGFVVFENLLGIFLWMMYLMCLNEGYGGVWVFMIVWFR